MGGGLRLPEGCVDVSGTPSLLPEGRFGLFGIKKIKGLEMRFIPENLALLLTKKEVKTVVGYLVMDKEMNEILIKKMVKHGNRINNKEE